MINADWAISHVQYGEARRIENLNTHQVFAGLLGNAPIAISRANMIKMIRDEGKHVVTVTRADDQWVQGEDVRVTSKGYLRTDPNETEADNLGNLPEFKRPFG
jgi:hypothetical protein